MKKNQILLIFLFINFIGFSQTLDSKISHLGNTYSILLEENSEHKYDLIITNETNDGLSLKRVIANDITEAEFEKTITSKFDVLTDTYLFKSEMVDSLKIKSSELKNYSFENFVENLVPNKKWLLTMFKKKIEFENYKDFIENKLTLEKNNLFDKLDIVVKQVNGKKEFAYVFNSGEPKSFNNLADFENVFYDLAKENRALLTNFYSNEELKETIKSDLIKSNSKALSNIYKRIIANDNYKLLGNYTSEIVKGSPEIIKDTYEVSVKQDLSRNLFVLNICGSISEACKHTIKLDLKIEPSVFKNEVNNTISKLRTGNKLSDRDIDNLYIKCINSNEGAIIKEANKPIQKELKNKIKQIEDEKTSYSGILKLNEEIIIYNNKVDSGKRFKPDYATFRVFNNRAKTIVVEGSIVNKDGVETSTENISINFQYSVPFRALTDGSHNVSIWEGREKIGIIYYSDIFKYSPDGKKFNYAAKNKDYNVKVNDTVRVEQRKLADYFTPVIFTDFLGLNSNNSNSLIVAEGKMKVPIWIRNWNYFTFIPTLRANVNVALYNGFDDDSRVISEEGTNTFTNANINTFDYVKYANINANITLDLLSVELKGLSTDISFGTGIRYYRTGYKYTNTSSLGRDEVFTDQLNALAPELSLNFQIRPQGNFGADLTLIHSWLNARGTKENSTIIVPQTEKDKRLLQVNLDFYFKLTPKVSNNGVYFRMGGWYHNETKDFFPQFMVGYATNLSSFVNKFKEKDEIE
ncbi:hypothetical protein [Pseudofulvibacter geojedonensis]|uniref:Uncharacterized protein n=1 Tax=Pseudofulvibacter geojedonensis TaxID=1123758 RepID=A0ABW3I0I2_9FLAO